MSDRMAVGALGTRIDVALSDSPELNDEIRAAWVDATLDADGIPGPSSAEVSTREWSTDPSTMLSWLSSAITQRAMDLRRGELWMLHAGGVADEAGRVALLVGPSGAGKTTATRHLARSFEYVSDETIGITSDGAVLRYRKPLSLVVPNARHKRQVSATELAGASRLSPALTLGCIILLDRSPSAPDAPQLAGLDDLEAITELVPQSSHLTAMRSPLHTMARHLARVPAFRLSFRDDTALESTIARALASPAPPPRLRGVDEPDRATVRPETAPAGIARYRRAEFADAITAQEGTALAVLQSMQDGSGRLTVLSGVAPAIWRAAASTSTLDELTDACVLAHGAPESGTASATVRLAVDDLVSAGILKPSTMPASGDDHPDHDERDDQEQHAPHREGNPRGAKDPERGDDEHDLDDGTQH